MLHWGVPDIENPTEELNAHPEFVIFSRETCYRPKGLGIHTCKFLKAEKYTFGISSTPALAFLQVASEFSVHQLILLGQILCSYDKPFCTLKELKTCANDLRGLRGWSKANRALQYVTEGSNSIMEAKLYMALSLPHALGGCGITGFVLNTKIYCPKHKIYFIPDLCLPKCDLIIEYDSFQHHNNSTSFSNDTDRAAILESEGYQVISVKPKQLKNLRSYSTLIQNIHKRIGKQLRVRSVKFYTGFVQLWELIQNHSPFSSPQLNRSHYEKVRLSDVPCFPGVDAKYNEYLNSWDERVKKY